MAVQEDRMGGGGVTDQRNSKGEDGGRTFQHEYAQLERLYEIGRLLADFEDVETTFPRVLAAIATAVPISTAVLIAPGPAGPQLFVWPVEGIDGARVRRAAAHARAAYDYLVEAGADKAMATRLLSPMAT